MTAHPSSPVRPLYADPRTEARPFAVGGETVPYFPLAEASADLIAVFNAEFRYVYVNATLERFLGTARETLLGRIVWEVFPHSSDTEVGQQYRAAMRTGETREFEMHYPPRDGWFAVRCVPQPDGGGLIVFARETTAQHRSERARGEALAALRASEERLRLALASAAMVTWEWRIAAEHGDLSHALDDAGAVQVMRSGEVGESVRETAADFFARLHPDDLAAFRETVREVVNDPCVTEYTAEFRLRPSTPHKMLIPDGEHYRWAAVRGRIERDPATGAAIKASGVRWDIHDRKTMEIEREEAHRRQEALLGALDRSLEWARRITSAMPATVYLFDLVERRMVLVEQTLKTARDFRAADLMRMGASVVSATIHPNDLPSVERLIAYLRNDARDGESVTHLRRVRWADADADTDAKSVDSAADSDRWRWMEERSTVLERDADGRGRLTLGVSVEVTERVRQEEAIRRSEARYRALAEATALSVWTATPSGAIIPEDSPAWRAFLGLGDDAPSVFGWPDSFHPDDRERTRERWAHSIGSGEPYENEYRVRRHDGVWRCLRSRAFAVRDERGAILEWVGATSDVTDRREAEKERARAAARDRRIASTLQTVLQPEAHAYRHAGLTAIPVSKPLRSDQADVGGDWHDCIPLTGGRVALVLGDCMGHGIEAALAISEVRFALRAFLREDPDPSRALQRLNHSLIDAGRLEQRPKNTLVGLALAVIDTATGEAEVCVAGAEAPLLYRAATGHIEEITGGDLILGAFPDALYTSERLLLRAGDVLLLASDGLAEARGSGNQFCSCGVKDALRRAMARTGNGTGDAGDAADALRRAGEGIMEDARAFAGGTFKDDVTALLVRWSGALSQPTLC